MATCNSHGDQSEDKREERRKQVMLGELPSDFLRVTPITAEQQLSVDEQAAIALQQQLFGHTVPSTVTGRLTISVIEAKLNKNYGLTRMDPYVKLSFGIAVYETNTDYNGAKNPRWNKNFNCIIPQDTSFLIEVYDERAFSMDERIAWATYDIPESVRKGETANEWIELTGKLGEGKEGVINLVISCQPIPYGTYIYHRPQPMFIATPYGTTCAEGTSVYPHASKVPAVASSPCKQSSEMSEEDLKQVKDMFPNIEEEVVRAVSESNCGNKDQTINALLELSEGT